MCLLKYYKRGGKFMSSVFYIWLLIRVLTCIISDYYIKYHIVSFKDRVDKHEEPPVC